MNIKFKNTFALLLFVIVQAGYSMPQGFFSQGLSIPKIVSWNNNERSLAILPNVKVASPIKSSHFNVFGKKNTDDKKTKKEPQLQQNNNLDQVNEEFNSNQPTPIKINQENKPEQSNNIQGIKLPNLKQEDPLISKFSDSIDIAPDNQNVGNEITTELLLETTTDGLETTTIDDDVFNRSSPQLVASLLG